jgi:pimeloyl-ACP methyl ester carboxylesterase
MKGAQPAKINMSLTITLVGFAMRIARKLVRGLGALALAVLLAGCATPIGIRIVDPREVQRYLTRSALTDQRPSDFSQNELRRYDLLEAYDDEPDSALAKLHAAALARGWPPAALFALAELSFLRAGETELQAGYAAALIYSYALLFPEQGHAPLNELDPRERVAADLYNRALTSAFKRTKKGTLALDGSGEIALPFGRISVARSPDMLQMSGSELYDLQPVAEIEVRGLRNRYRRPGIGAPLAAKTRPLPGVVQVVPVPALMRLPLTAVVRIDSPLAGLSTGDVHARVDLYASLDTETIELAGRRIPLEAEPTASLAASLSESQFWKRELQVFLGNAIGVRKESALVGLRPYKQGRIPVVFVHGTASSPARWADMVNDLLADAQLRDRYAFWFFTYDSGNPIAYSGYQLRHALTQAVDRADLDGRDPCVGDMVVMGHSQGGLLTKLTVIDSGDNLWRNVTDKPFDDLKLGPEDKELLRNTLFVKPLPFVREVIFLATPQQGSYLAGPRLVRRLAEYFVRLPSDVVRVGAGLATLAPAGAGELSLMRMPTSIDNMSPGNRFIKAIARIPVSPTVTAHSIIAVDADKPLDQAGDGVVKYQSAHVAGVDSELIVRSPHSGMQAAPATIEEVRRILLAHSARSACPVPAS